MFFLVRKYHKDNGYVTLGGGGRRQQQQEQPIFNLKILGLAIDPQ